MSAAPYYQDEHVTVLHGDCLNELAALPDASVDAVVTDPPYGLANTTPEQVADTLVRWVNGERDYMPTGAGFMGKAWDAFVPPVAVWDECLRVLKPGGHVLAFAGSRTFDLMSLGIRLAGFDIRDSIAWLYGSGFPKSLDVSKAIDRELTRELEFTAWMRTTGVTARQLDEVTGTNMGGRYLTDKSQPAIPTAALLDLMRPILPPIPQWIEDEVATREAAKAEARARNEGAAFLAALARGERTTYTPEDNRAARWQGWGTALKPAFEPVVVARKPLIGTVAANVLAHGTGALNIDGCRISTDEDRSRPPRTPNAILGNGKGTNLTASESNPAGRWPTNVVLDESQAAELDQQSGELTSGKMRPTHTTAGRSVYGQNAEGGFTTMETYGDTGGASRFFPTFRYEAKAPTAERPRVGGVAHPTVKPLDLMRWLVRLVTPPGGVVLEPFAGSGTTVEACVAEGLRCIAIEREADYLPLIMRRLERRDPTAPATVEVAPGALQDGFDFGEVAS